MRTINVAQSMDWVGANRSGWIGAINPLDADFPIGTTTVTLTNIVDGSSLQIESQDGSQIFHTSTVAGTSKAVTLSVYSAGSALSSLRIKIRKGTASPYYIPWETILTAAVGSTSIYVAQIPDE